ncbi:SubName: Full=Uncharacterized protein {ECO:0000313/EMBL:CCA74327.1} [Serendipita indica DSM 11827]|nr:SubName: Full=Uncharacterized protein {ECO:0000313/EMBL:CCA74327.1} [Serendipita indica DSM 11827]
MKSIFKNIPKKLMKIGGLRVLGSSQVIRGTWAASRVTSNTLRDSSYVRLALLRSSYTPDGTIVDKETCSYVCLHHILVAEVSSSSSDGIHEASRELLAYVSACNTQGDATQESVWYSELRAPEFVHINTIQCVVGRIKVGKRWGIIDTSLNCARTTFVGPEDIDLEANDS